jgi:DNA-binding Lrp family transcriptional regulator
MRILDDLDRRLVSLLREDGRAPVARLAADLKVSRATVDSRIRRLLDSGALLGFTARVRSDYDAGSVRAIMLIEVAGKSTTAVIRSLRGIPELEALHTTNGAWDLVAEINAPSLGYFDRVLRTVREIDGVQNSETSLLLSSV